MKANVLMILPPDVMTDCGTFKLHDIQGHVRVGAVIDTETMKVVVNNVNEDCINGACPVR